MLIVTKLDRFARSTADGSVLINELLNRGVAVHILNTGLFQKRLLYVLNSLRDVS